MSMNTSEFKPLAEEDLALFDSYKEAIYARIHETFPSISNDYEFQPIGIFKQIGCGTFYTYKLTLPDKKFATISFHLGGRFATPRVEPPPFDIQHFE